MLYFEGHGDLVSRLIVGIIAIITWLVRVVNLLSPHDSPKTLNPKPFGILACSGLGIHHEAFRKVGKRILGSLPDLGFRV